MAYAEINVLQKASQLLGYQYTIESTEDEAGKKLLSTLQQAVDELLGETDWVFARKMVELSPDADENNQYYGYQYSYKIPNDLARQIALYPFFFKKGGQGFTGGFYNGSSSMGPSMGFLQKTIPTKDMPYNYRNTFITGAKGNVFFKTERIGNNLYSNVKTMSILYISNEIKNLLQNTNEYWFIELLAYKLAIINAFTQANSTTTDYLEKKFNIKLKNAKNKNEYIRAINEKTSTLEVYPFYADENNYYE
jgi:hypothetical protein